MAYLRERYIWSSSPLTSPSTSSGNSSSIPKGVIYALSIIGPLCIIGLILLFCGFFRARSAKKHAEKLNSTDEHVPPYTPVENPSESRPINGTHLNSDSTIHPWMSPPYTKITDTAPPYYNIDKDPIISTSDQPVEGSTSNEVTNDVQWPQTAHCRPMV